MQTSATSPSRQALLSQLAAEVLLLPADPYIRVGIDGVDGAGKSVFAGELVAALRVSGREVVHASVDDFHRPRALRHARGPRNPEGFYRDSHDVEAFTTELLDPFAPGGHGLHRTRVFDVRTDTAHSDAQQQARPGAILVVDGIFLHRPGLRAYWSWSIWLEVERATSLQRCVARDESGSADPTAPSNRRYVEGQRLYMREAAPQQQATHVIDNNNLAQPVLLR